METRTKVYPASCTSDRCGNIKCDGCAFKPDLDEFKRWVKASGAVPVDPIWSSLVYVVK